MQLKTQLLAKFLQEPLADYNSSHLLKYLGTSILNIVQCWDNIPKCDPLCTLSYSLLLGTTDASPDPFFHNSRSCLTVSFGTGRGRLIQSLPSTTNEAPLMNLPTQFANIKILPAKRKDGKKEQNTHTIYKSLLVNIPLQFMTNKGQLALIKVRYKEHGCKQRNYNSQLLQIENL